MFRGHFIHELHPMADMNNIFLIHNQGAVKVISYPCYYTGWPIRLVPTSCWHHNKSCVLIWVATSTTFLLMSKEGWELPDGSPCILGQNIWSSTTNPEWTPYTDRELQTQHSFRKRRWILEWNGGPVNEEGGRYLRGRIEFHPKKE